MVTETLEIGRIALLALADSINPCAIAVLAMVLIAVLTNDPTKRKKVLFSGFSFVLAVIIGYLFYGIVFVQLFKSLGNFISNYSFYLYNGLAILAMLIGALQIKDFFYYKKGSFATEMPLWMRPKAKKIITQITSPKGAFIIGFLVTVFLLPCTIGPYLIASALLSPLGVLQSIPWLLFYNIIFVLPMIIIILIIYYGIKKVDEVSGWKEKNIRLLHLIAGILLFIVGFSLLIGWI